MNTNSELHVIFGAGPVGRWTARELARMGKQVRVVNRSGQAASLPTGVEVVKGDAYDARTVKSLTAGAVSVYQCAQPEYHEWAEKFPPLQAAILEGSTASGAKLIVVENLYAYGDPAGKAIVETQPHHPHTRKGQVRLAMNETLMSAHQSGKVRVAIGRASNFIGPEYDLTADMVFYPALQGKAASAMGNPDVPHSFTYVPDFGRALAVLGTQDEALGQVWHVPCLEAISQRDLLKMIYAEAGTPFKMRVIGTLMMRLAGLFNAGARESVEMMYEWQKPWLVDSSKFQRTFGLKATPLADAIRQSVAFYRAALNTSQTDAA